MKLQKIKLQNFAKFSDIEVVFDGRVTHLVGMNGAGKSTIGVTAIQAGLKGIAEKNKDGQLIGERFRFIGPAKKSADIVITIVDEAKGGAEIIVKNRITESGNNISFEAPDGYDISGDWLNNLLNVAFLSAKNFCQLSPKEQALLLGIDVSGKDKEIADAKAEVTNINRDIKNLGSIDVVLEAQEVSVSTLLKEKSEIDARNEVTKAANAEIERIRTGVEGFEQERDELLARIVELESKISKGKKWLEGKAPKPLESTDDVVKMIESAEEINKKAAAYKVYKEKADKLEQLMKQKNAATARVDKLVQQRMDVITSFNFGFEGLNVDEDGGLLLNGRPIRDPYYSKGELEVIVAKLYVTMNPKLKMRFIDDFDLIDEDNQVKLVAELLEAGFQIITAEVGKAKAGDNVLILREGVIHKNNSL